MPDHVGTKRAASLWPDEVYDLNATLLHLLGNEHTRLTFKFQDRDYRLTDMHSHVVKELLA
jgi:hypothetical protein